MERIMVVDAHVHFWDPVRLHYAWLDAEPSIRRPFLPRDFTPLTQRQVDAVVFVQADCAPAESALEVEWVERLAADEPRIAGIVAFADLLDEANLAAALDRLGRSPRVVGVRQNIQGHPRGFALQDEFVRGVRALGARGLPFDLCITGNQVGEAVELVSRCPDTRFVLDHCGKPAIRDDLFAPWAAEIERLAAHPGVSCKISGLLTEARAEQRHADALRRYVDHVAACFGPARLLYGSDWPVSNLGGGAEGWFALVEELTSGWSASDRESFFAGNAIRFYELPVLAHG